VGVLSALDARNASARAMGTSGLLQMASYLSALSAHGPFELLSHFSCPGRALYVCSRSIRVNANERAVKTVKRLILDQGLTDIQIIFRYLSTSRGRKTEGGCHAAKGGREGSARWLSLEVLEVWRESLYHAVTVDSKPLRLSACLITGC